MEVKIAGHADGRREFGTERGTGGMHHFQERGTMAEPEKQVYVGVAP